MKWCTFLENLFKTSPEFPKKDGRAFTLTEGEYRAGTDWIKKKYEKHAQKYPDPEDGNFYDGPPVHFQWRFISGPIGQKCTVFDSLDNEEFDITDYSIW